MERLATPPRFGGDATEQPSPQALMRRFCDLDADVRALRDAQGKVVSALEQNHEALGQITEILLEIRDATRDSNTRVAESRDKIEGAVEGIREATEATAAVARELGGMASQIGLMGGAVVRATEEVQRDREARERGT